MNHQHHFAFITAFMFFYAAGFLRAALVPRESDEWNGRQAPTFSLHTVVDGKELSSPDYKGRIILLNFFASWCPPCRAEITSLIEIQRKYSQQGIIIIGVAVDSLLTPETVKEVKPFVEKLDLPYPVTLATKKVAEDFRFEGIPTLIFIGANGKFFKVLYGPNSAGKIEDVVKKILTESKAGSRESSPQPKPKS